MFHVSTFVRTDERATWASCNLPECISTDNHPSCDDDNDTQNDWYRFNLAQDSLLTHFSLSLSSFSLYSTILIHVHLAVRMAISLCSPVLHLEISEIIINFRHAHWKPSSRFWTRKHVVPRDALPVSRREKAVGMYQKQIKLRRLSLCWASAKRPCSNKPCEKRWKERRRITQNANNSLLMRNLTSLRLVLLCPNSTWKSAQMSWIRKAPFCRVLILRFIKISSSRWRPNRVGPCNLFMSL